MVRLHRIILTFVLVLMTSIWVWKKLNVGANYTKTLGWWVLWRDQHDDRHGWKKMWLQRAKTLLWRPFNSCFIWSSKQTSNHIQRKNASLKSKVESEKNQTFDLREKRGLRLGKMGQLFFFQLHNFSPISCQKLMWEIFLLRRVLNID